MVKLHGVLFAVLAFAAVVKSQEYIPKYTPDVFIPLDGIITRLDTIGMFNLEFLIAFLVGALTCLATPAQRLGELSLLKEQLIHGIPDMEAKISLPENMTEEIKEFMKTKDFVVIHNFLWEDPDSEWNDLIAFMYRTGFNKTPLHGSIYDFFIKLYADLDAGDICLAPSEAVCLPIEPPTIPPRLDATNNRQKRAVNQPLPAYMLVVQQILQNLMQDPEPSCLEQVIKDLMDSHLIEWVEFLRYTLTTFNNDPSIHYLFGKLTEHRKGEAFREFRQLQEMTLLINTVNDKFKANDLVQLIAKILKDFLGLDFSEMNINIIDNFISIIEYLVWRTPFPVPS